MEEKGFLWLSRVLATARSRVKVLETVFFRSAAIDFWVHTDFAGCIKRKNAGEEEDVSSYAEALSYFLTRLRLQGKSSGAVPLCYTVWKGARSVLDSAQAEEFLTRRDSSALRCAYIQEFKEPRGHRLFIYCTKYTPGLGYVSSLGQLAQGVSEKLANSRARHKLRDVQTVILTAIERVKTKRVVELELEYLQDEEGLFWLMGCSKCRVAAPNLCTDLASTRSTEAGSDRKSRQATVPKPVLAEGKFVFRKGQLRNQVSNLNSPLRIISPDSSPEPQPVDQSSEEKVASSKVKSVKYQNSNFQELLQLHFAKKSKFSPVLTGEKEFLFRCLESSIPQSESEGNLLQPASSHGKFKLTPFRLEDVQPIGIDSSGSYSSDQSDFSIPPIPTNSDHLKLPYFTPVPAKPAKKGKKLVKSQTTKSMKSPPSRAAPVRMKSWLLTPVLQHRSRLPFTRSQELI